MADTRADSPVSTPRKRGRPSKFNQKLADKICAQLATGKSARTVLKGDGMPTMETFWKWLRTNTEFAEQYTRAKEEAADALAEEIQDIADDSRNDWMEERFGKDYKTVFNREHYERSKIRIDTRKFLMSKMKPKRYGDKLDLTSDGKELPTPIFGGISVTQLAENTHEKPADDSGD